MLQGIRDMRALENVPAALSRPRSPMFPGHSLLCSVGMDERGASRHTGWGGGLPDTRDDKTSTETVLSKGTASPEENRASPQEELPQL